MAAHTRNRRLLIVGILAYVLFLLALFPINIAYKLIDPEALPVSVEGLSGTLWKGQAIVKQSQIGRVDLNWALSPMGLLFGQVNTEVKASSQKAVFNGQLILSAAGTLEVINGKGFVSASLVNQFAHRQRASLAGDFELSGLNLIYDTTTKQADNASGRLVWQGGQVSYPVARKTKNANMPMLVANLSSTDGVLNASVKTVEGNVVAEANLKTDGWAGVAIKRRLVDLAGEQWLGKADADTTVFEVSEKVF